MALRFDYPFLLNNTRNNQEKEVFKDILDEATYLYGQDFYYITTELKNEIFAFGEYKTKIPEKATAIRLVLDELDAFDGPGNMFSKFGMRLGDSMIVYGSKRLFSHFNILPKPQDIIYYPVTDKLFEITYVTDENFPGVHYPLGENYAYKLTCKLYTFDYNSLETDTVENSIDSPEVFRTLSDVLAQETAKEKTQFNDKVDSDKVDIVDDSEKDPLLGE